ncbi:lipase 3-like [Anticarsia gemmatalis]|uniref:lipase 3-like n=1 Tax=Anticarsia gemmatalis TaxID=129554 RepID=UPI003F76DA95
MDVFLPLVLLSAVTPHVTSKSWSFVPAIHDLFKEPPSITNFFEEQGDKVKTFVTTSYNDAVKMKDSVESYVEQQQNVFVNEMNNYYEDIKESGRKVADTWSYVPEGDTASLLDNPDVVLTVPGIISRHGYICETHTIISQGYVLNVHRIPHSRTNTKVPSKTVFLQHGLFASSADWIINGPGKGLAYVLADAGYDVWMANIRGNRYSKEHIWYKSDSKSYWNFSWHDVALYDVPEIIQYILKTKGEGTKITYIGHSMGTTILFAMLSMKPEYNNILTAGFALAPVVYLSDMKSPLKSLAPIAGNLASMDMLQGTYEFIPKNSPLGKISNTCNGQNVDSLVCKNIVFYLCGFNEKQYNKTLLPVFLAHIGTGTSWKTAVHFSQEILSGKFQYFDYGAFYNSKIYGSDSPPEYDLKKVTLPIKLFWSQNDLLSSERDVKMLSTKLPTKPDMFLVPDAQFNHLDYLWAIDAPRLLNNEVLNSLNTYMNKDNYLFSIRF